MISLAKDAAPAARGHAKKPRKVQEAFGFRLVATEVEERALARFASKVAQPDSPSERDQCWTWIGGVGGGYGRFLHRGRLHQAHRWIYEAVSGPVPDGWVVDHLCDNPLCVSPWHIEPTTPSLNVKRGRGRPSRTGMCRNGHEYTRETMHTDPRGYPRCRVCDTARSIGRLRCLCGCGKRTRRASGYIEGHDQSVQGERRAA